MAHVDGQPGTSCKTTVTFISKLGQNLMKRRKASSSVSDTVMQDATAQDHEVEEEQPKQGWFASLSTAGIQRTIELVGVKRTKTALIHSSEGMKIVLERLRNGGIKGVLDGMRHDRMEIMGGPAVVENNEPARTSWRDVWQRGSQSTNHNSHDDRDGDDYD